ncbi:RNA polymerase sigma-70 factor, ECF subfamily [bacterium A37T11]|nr:RNA polymerase sigma-70 factor, ECF subfamily [bacterium A37T11]
MPPEPLLNEKELLIRLREGDYVAFNIIYQQYNRHLLRNLLAILKDDALVEDTLQEVFFRIWEKRSSIDPEQSIKGYLIRIATNLAHDHFRMLAREQRREEVLVQYSRAFQQEYGAPNPSEQDKMLYRIIDKLPPQRKKVFVMCKFQLKSYQEVSSILKISVPAVKDHIIKANKFLKKNFPKAITIVGFLKLFF